MTTANSSLAIFVAGVLVLHLWLCAACGAEARPAPGKETVILLHGLGRGSGSMSKIGQALKADGFDVLNWEYPSREMDLTQLAGLLHRDVVGPHLDRGARVHFVTHSMGGIVLRRMLKLHPIEKPGRIVMIAPPNNGSAMARFALGLPAVKSIFGPAGKELTSKEHLDAICAAPESDVMVIAGTRSTDVKNPTSLLSHGRLEEPNDGTVSVAETKLPHMTAFIEVPDSHTWIMRNPLVIAAVSRFLAGDVAAPVKQVLDTALARLAADPGLMDEFAKDVPRLNVAARTSGGTVFWTDLAAVEGWRIQRNSVFGNCRILDPSNTRRAWGSKEEMFALCAKIAEQ